MVNKPIYSENNQRIVISTRTEFIEWLNKQYPLENTTHKKLMKLKESVEQQQ